MKGCLKELVLAPGVLCSLALMLAVQLNAQSFTIFDLYDFTGGSDGSSPAGGLILSGNILYGTAYYGGTSGNGTVFAFNSDGTGFTNLHSFAETFGTFPTNSDGANPAAGLLQDGDFLYGTAQNGGSAGNGTVFALNVDGSGFTTIYTFTNGIDGANPQAGLILSGNTLYGTDAIGGSFGFGTLFAVTTNGTDFTNLYSFSATVGTNGGIGTNSDGASPLAGLVLSGNTIYGTAEFGGSSGDGTVFAVNTDGKGFTNLHSFSATVGSEGGIGTNSDGARPVAALILSGNILYGTAEFGGTSGNGTVFAVNTDGTGFTNLHSFAETSGIYQTNSDGAYPGGLMLSQNRLYGTAGAGGTYGGGTVFALNTLGTGFTTIYDFGYFFNGDGARPTAGLVLSGNTLYGTAGTGGKLDNGTIFKVEIDMVEIGSGLRVLYSFTGGNDGATPLAGLVLSGDHLYGTTFKGGISEYGTVFQVSTNGNDLTNVYDFTNGIDGANPSSGLVLSSNTLFGTAGAGGSTFGGTVFSLNPNGRHFNSIYAFSSDSVFGYPSGLILSGDTLYGTAAQGGSFGHGAVFALNTDGNDFTNLYNFTATTNDPSEGIQTNHDGTEPQSVLILSGNTLFGTAFEGGGSGDGTVFSVNTDGTSFRILHGFSATPLDPSTGAFTNSDGAFPSAGLILSGSTLYGTAEAGGSSGTGTVFAVTTNGTGFITVYNFGPKFYNSAIGTYTNSDGIQPGPLILSGNGLYGTAEYGGSSGTGTVFAVTTNGAGFTTLYSFSASADSSGSYTNSDGAFPVAALILSGNTLYGTTSAGGSSGDGTVFALSPLSVQITGNPTSGLVPLTVNFSSSGVDNLGNSITNWNWSFGDGSTSTAQNTSHTYTVQGNFSPNLLAINDNGEQILSSGLSITAELNTGLVLNGGFDTGDFSQWTLSGDISDTFVDNGSQSGITPHSGNYEAALGTSSSLGYLSQSLSTTAGASYLLSFWLDTPYEDPGVLLVSWNGSILLDTTNLDANNWTNLQFAVSATGASTVLQFGFQDDYDWLALDDISVFPLNPGFANFSLSGTSLVLNGTNGQSGRTYYLLMSTNLALPLSKWTPVATNVLSTSGNFTITATNAASPTVPQGFYILQMQ